MRRTVRFSMIYAILALAAVSTFAQSSSRTGTGALTGTVIDIDNGRGRLQIESDEDRYARTSIETDSISTQYLGFGTMIAGKPEIFTGSSGFSNIRLGDRISIRGYTRADGMVHADAITLLGRQVAAGTVGVGQTRNPTSVSTPTDDRVTGTTPTASTTAVEGTVRQINLDEGRIVIQTTQRRMITVNTYRNTPVVFRGEQYRLTNLEIGDRIRIDPDPRTAQTDEITARRIEVTQSVQEARGNEGGTVTAIEGRVLRIDEGLDYAYVDAGRGEVRVDMGQAEDARGERIHARDLRAGDVVEISGNYTRAGDIFMASTVRLGAGGSVSVTAPRGPLEEEFVRYSVITFTGTVQETLADAPAVTVLDTDLKSTVKVWVIEDFAVRTKGLTYTNAEALKVGDTVLVKAYRDTRGNLIAQSIRLRNR
jgi:Domain of unknown function (DUF5666)